MKYFFSLFIFLSASALFAQQGELKGTVTDELTKETLVGAGIIYAPGKGTVTDINGFYSIKLDTGNYTVSIKMAGFQIQEQKVHLMPLGGVAYRSSLSCLCVLCLRLRALWVSLWSL